ncbi:GNAT family N-acetyltransferase [Vibrio ulleungensis]|uniref:GNAT family N-acetyltransferase n=1 Tax=Vibrio ulleungensis TaxID=2807619 RepID=A0ABS2HFJ9_9VIBR|nr:GNAT family N-acetyltransferase [Vibrio ulleungensis]MBM7035152.1 GNAT family N-acetyltransferase [Vibrio ulleungensis]
MDYSHISHPDIESLKSLFLETFTDSESAEEGQVVSGLVAAILSTTEPSLVEVFGATESELQAAIILTKLETSTQQSAYLLSPVAVATKAQGQGVGQALIQFARSALADQGVELLFTYGDPSFYGKVGFEQIDNNKIVAPQPLSHPMGWLGQSLAAENIADMSMTLTTVAAFDDPNLW